MLVSLSFRLLSSFSLRQRVVLRAGWGRADASRLTPPAFLLGTRHWHSALGTRHSASTHVRHSRAGGNPDSDGLARGL